MSANNPADRRSAHILDTVETVTICAHIHGPSQKTTFSPRRWMQHHKNDLECTNAFDRLVKPLLNPHCFTHPVHFYRHMGNETRLAELSVGMQDFRRPSHPTYLVKRIQEEWDREEQHSVLSFNQGNYIKVSGTAWFEITVIGSRLRFHAVHEMDHRRLLKPGTHFFA